MTLQHLKVEEQELQESDATYAHSPISEGGCDLIWNPLIFFHILNNSLYLICSSGLKGQIYDIRPSGFSSFRGGYAEKIVYTCDYLIYSGKRREKNLRLV